MLLCILVVLVCAVSTANSSKCPQPEFVYPCTCRPWETGVFVVCNQVNNTNRLKTVFQTLRSYEITRLLLKDCHLVESGGPGIFNAMNIKLLRLIDSSLTRRDNSSRLGPVATLAPYLERLDLTNCGGLFKVSHLSLGPLYKLKDLNVVRDDSLSNLTASLFPNPSVLTNLRLEQCGITNIGTGTFTHMTSLKSLTLLKNQLATVRRDALPRNCAELLSIDLSENRIDALPTDFFEGMNNVHTVNLYDNRLQSLGQTTWSPVWSRLEKLWITENNIKCDNSVAWIFEQERNPPLLIGICAAPESLRGTQIAQLTRDVLQPNS